MKVLRTILISVGTAFFAVACGALLLFNWHSGGWQTLDVPTGSMRPTIPPSSLVLVHRVPNSAIKVGDVITYTNPRNKKISITHRVINILNIGGKVPAYRTKGDANSSIDPWIVIGGQVRGKAVWHIANLGRVLVWSKTWVGLVVLLYLPALLLMIEEVQRLAEYLRAMQPYKLPGYRRVIDASSGVWRKWVTSGMVALGLVVISGAFALPVHALLKSNTVSLVHNRIRVIPSHRCNSHNDNDINISNTNNQSASTGNATSKGNTNGSSANSGNASNSNNTNIDINLNNC